MIHGGQRKRGRTPGIRGARGWAPRVDHAVPTVRHAPAPADGACHGRLTLPLLGHGPHPRTELRKTPTRAPVPRHPPVPADGASTVEPNTMVLRLFSRTRGWGRPDERSPSMVEGMPRIRDRGAHGPVTSAGGVPEPGVLRAADGAMPGRQPSSAQRDEPCRPPPAEPSPSAEPSGAGPRGGPRAAAPGAPPQAWAAARSGGDSRGTIGVPSAPSSPSSRASSGSLSM